MKAIVLAGGYGTRIRPCSFYLNKHMWPIYDRPLIEHVIDKLIWADITNIAFVLGGSHPRQVQNYLGDGARYGCSFTYVWQGAPRGIANAVSCCKNFCGDDKFIVHLADNIFEDDLAQIIGEFNQGSYDCLVVLKKVENPKRFGVAEVKDGKLVSLEEKPLEPKSNLALTGVYGFNTDFFNFFKSLKPSWRGEYELTDIISAYVKENKKVLIKILDGHWFSCDTFDNLLEASNFIFRKAQKRLRRNQR